MHLSYCSLRVTDTPRNNEPHREHQPHHSENLIFAVGTTQHSPALYCHEQESKTDYTITVQLMDIKRPLCSSLQNKRCLPFQSMTQDRCKQSTEPVSVIQGKRIVHEKQFHVRRIVSELSLFVSWVINVPLRWNFTFPQSCAS